MGYEDLLEKTNAATTNFNTLSVQIKDLESRINANAELQKQIVNYAKTRAVYVEYRKAGYSKKFRTEHETEILLHKAAKNHFDELGINCLLYTSIGQLVITPIVIADFVTDLGTERGTGSFGSTGE